MNRWPLAMQTILFALVAFTAPTPTASAYWGATGTGSGIGHTDTMPTAAQPTTSVAGSAVTLDLNQSTIGGLHLGAIGGGYEIRRYPAAGGAASTPNGACGSLVTGSSAAIGCIETPAPPGEWVYRATPVLFGWTGVEGSPSAVTSVAPESPANVSATPQPLGVVALDWDSSPGATGYNIYRSTTAGVFNYGTPLNGSTPIVGNTYSDTSAASGTTYFYVVRALVIGGSGQQIESNDSYEISALSDSTSPTAVTIASPPALLRGSITLSGSASDTVSGVMEITFQYKPSAGSTWLTGCLATAAPFNCVFDTTSTADGLYDFRAVASDHAGNATASAVVTARLIDNTAPAATMTNPGSHIRASVTLSGSSSDGGSGVTASTIEYRALGGGAWTTACSSATASVSCRFNSTSVLEGDYEMRVTSTDAAGNVGYSAIWSPVRIDNTRPTAADVQTVNNGTLGRPEAGDLVIYTFSEEMQPSTILAAFTGASMNVTVRLNNQANNDRLFIYDAANVTVAGIGELRTGRNYVTANRTFSNSTIAMVGNTLTLTLGTASGAVNTVTNNATLRWRPGTVALDLAGNRMRNTAGVESGAADPNF
ncbi:MAG: hypothetical protein ACPGYP_06330 [Solirubrobacterales bacterium]